MLRVLGPSPRKLTACRAGLEFTPRAQLCSQSFVTSPTGLQLRNVFVPDEGKRVEDGDLVSVHFTGRLGDGTVFNTSLDESMVGNQPEFGDGVTSEELKGWDRGIPVQFTAGHSGEVIQGLHEGVLGMRVGGKREMLVPPELGYSDASAGELNAQLHVEVELLDVGYRMSTGKDADGDSPPSLWSRIFGS